MSANFSCTVHEFPIPDREYYAAPAAQWDRPAAACPRRRTAPSRVRPKPRRRRSALPLTLLLIGLALFAGGFLLGRADAAGEEDPLFSLLPGEPEESPLFSPLPEKAEEDGSVQVRTVPGAVLSTGEEKISAASEDDWRLILVNGEHPLPESFQIPQLTQLRGGHAVDSRAYPELQRMMDDCRAEGLEPLICSSYRSWDKQTELFENKVRSCLASASSRQEAEERASEWVSRPGTSEHQAGLALDIVDKSYQLLDEGQEETAVQKWLMAHCAEYGFILRYPTEKSAFTGVGYEPWHYRYVGTEAAKAIMSRGLCLEEYLEERQTAQ